MKHMFNPLLIAAVGSVSKEGADYLESGNIAATPTYSESIWSAFAWCGTPQGYDFWLAIAMVLEPE